MHKKHRIVVNGGLLPEMQIMFCFVINKDMSFPYSPLIAWSDRVHLLRSCRQVYPRVNLA